MASIIKRLWSGSDFWDKEENKQQRQQFIQDTKPTPGPSILSTVHNTINDTLNANTQADQQRRLSQGLPRYYQDQSNLSKITRAAETGGRVTARVLQGIGQDAAGAYDLLTPGHGTNRATKYYQNRGAQTDQEVKDMGLDENVYKAGQVPLALGSYMIPGKAVSSAAKATQIAKVPQVVKLAGTLNKVPGVTKTIGALDDLAANGNRFQRITANLARSYTRPGNIADVGVDALQNAGHRTSLGQDNSAGTLALDAGMSLGMQGGMNLAGQGASAVIRAANAGIVQPTTRLVRNVANTVAPVQTTTKLIPRTGRLDLATSDALKAYNNMLVGADPNIQGKVQSDLIARIQQIGKENGVDLTNGSVEQRMARVEAMLNGYLPQTQTGRQFVGKPLGEGGYIRLPGQPTELMVTHNLSAENLAKAQELGGIPQASVGIVDPSKTAIDGYGEITLVGNNGLVDPKNRGTKTFASDVYSPRQPRSKLTGDRQVYENLRKRFGGEASELGQRYLGFDSDNALDSAISNERAVMLSFLRSKGKKIDNPSNFDRYEYNRTIRDAGWEEDFDTFTRQVAQEAGAKPTLFDGTTNTGRHREIPETMENILKIMRKDKIRAGEQGFGAHGLGNIRARITPEFKSIKEIVDNKGRLTSKEAMDATKEVLDSKMDKIQGKLDKYAVNKDSNGFMEYDSQQDAIGDYLVGGRENIEWFNNKFKNVPDSVMRELNAFKKELQDAPTEYFESVSDRAVKLNEFEKALIPEGLPKSQREAIVDRLNKEGIQPRFYKEGQRQQALQDLMAEDNVERGFGDSGSTKKMNQGGYVKNPFYRGDDVAGGKNVDPLESLKQEARKLDEQVRSYDMKKNFKGFRESDEARKLVELESKLQESNKTISRLDNPVDKVTVSQIENMGRKAILEGNVSKADLIKQFNKMGKEKFPSNQKRYIDDVYGSVEAYYDDVIAKGNAGVVENFSQVAGVPTSPQFEDFYKRTVLEGVKNGATTNSDAISGNVARRTPRSTTKANTANDTSAKSIAGSQRTVDQSQPPKSTAVQPDPLESLKQEARKYKSAEEFVKAKANAYHGTAQDFDVFDFNMLGSNTKSRTTGLGAFATENIEQAKRFAGKDGVVKNVSLELKNPLVLSAKEKQVISRTGQAVTEFDGTDPFTAVREAIIRYNKLNDSPVITKADWDKVNQTHVKNWKDAVEKQGYDGITIKDTEVDYAGDSRSTMNIAFRPDQFKTEKQLTDLYNQAQKESQPKAKSVETPLQKSNRLHEEKLRKHNLTQNEYAALHDKVRDLDQRANELHRKVGDATQKAIEEANGKPFPPKVRKELKAMVDEWGKALDDHVEAINQIRKIDGQKPIPRATQPQPPKSTPVQKQAPQPTKVATPFEKDLQAVGLAPKNTKPGLESRTPKKSLKTPQEKPVVSGTSRKLSTPEVKQPQNLQQPSTTASAGVGGQAVSKTQPGAYKQPKESQVSQNQVQSQESSSKTRGFIKSVLEDPNTNPKVKESISSLYTVRNTKELQTKAATLVKEHTDIAEQMSKSANDDASVAVAMELVKKHQNAGDYTRAIDLVESVAKDLTEAGRTVQAASIYGRLTPEGILRFTQKEINNYNKATGKDIKLTPKAADTLKTMADDLQKMPDGYDKDVAVAKMIAEVQKTMPATTAEKISTFQTMAQLLNPKTIIRNELGNSAFLGLENISQTVATPVDALMSLFTGKRTTTLPSVKTQVKGLIEGRKKGVSEAFQGINTGASTQYDLNSVPVFRGKVLGNLEKTMGAALRGGDRANYTAAFDDSLKGSMKLAKTKTATPEMLEAAHHAGLYRTFQDQNVISNFFVGMKKTLNTVGIGIKGKRFGLGDMVLKYPKTPANLLARGIDYSPAGFVKTVFEMSKPLFGKQFDQKVFVDSLSRATTGTAGLVGTGAMLGSLGIITEAPEKDKDLRDLQKQSGLGGYQINVSGLKRFVASGFSKDAAKLREGDKLVSYDWAQPAAIPVSMGAAIGKGKGAKEGAGKSVSALTEGIQTITEQPMVRGLQQFFGSNKGAGGIVGDLLKDTPASFIPTLSNQVRQLTDNTNRNTYDPSVLTESMNRVKNKIPGLASSVPARIGSLGETRENYQNGSNNPFNVFFNPSFVSNYDPKETAKLPLGINQRTGEVKQAPRSISTTQTVNGKSVKITAQQNQDLQKYVGTETDKAFSQLMKNPAFMALSDEEKANKMGTLITNINKAGKVLILGDEGYGTDSYKPTKLDRGVRDVLGGKYDYSTRSMKTGAASSDYAQQYADLKADFNDPNNGWSDVQKVAKTKELKRLEIKKDYDADTVALHSMSKADMYAYVSKAKNGKQLAEKLIAYDNALYEAGLSQYRKYKNGIAPASKGGGRKSGGRGGKRKAIPKDLMAKAMDVPKVAQLRQSKITAKQPQARSFKTRRKAIPKIAKSTPKLTVKRTQTA